MLRPTVLLCAVLALAAAGAACGSDNPDTGTTPTPILPTTEQFSGDGLNPNGARVHPFAVLAAGTVSATLTALDPDNGVTLGLALGTWNGAACAVTIANDAAITGTAVVGTASAAGNLCVRLYDQGNLTAPVSYLVTVTHF